jgi:hypothetical protein
LDCKKRTFLGIRYKETSSALKFNNQRKIQ